MPEVCNFFGIKIMFYYDEHNPPHFHAWYNSSKALINIKDASVMEGSLPSKKLKLVLAWTILHEKELLNDWELSRANKPLLKINPLTN